LAVIHAGAIKHTSVLSVGGNHITNDIAAGLRTPVAAAEEIKCRYGTALASVIGKDEVLDVPSTGGRSSRVLSKLVLSEIIEPRVHEILTMVQRDIVKSGCYDLLTGGLVITGGSSLIQGLTQASEKVFHLPVRIGSSIGVGGLTDLVKSPECATGVGLAVYGANAGISSRRSSNSDGSARGLVKKVANWFSDHF